MKWLIALLACLEFAGHPALAAGIEATIHWARRVQLSTPVSGVVKTVSVMPGFSVREGQVMLTLDPSPFQSALQRAQAEKDRAAVDRDEAKRDDDQAKQLYDNTVLSTVQLQNADNKYKRALADWRAADAAVAEAQYRLTQSAIRAPFDGWVLQRNAEPGQTVSSRLAPSTLLVVASADHYVARALLPAPQMDQISIGQQLQVKVAGKQFTGTVQSIGLEAAYAGKEVTYKVDVAFSSAKFLLREGQKAEIDLL